MKFYFVEHTVAFRLPILKFIYVPCNYQNRCSRHIPSIISDEIKTNLNEKSLIHGEHIKQKTYIIVSKCRPNIDYKHKIKSLNPFIILLKVKIIMMYSIITIHIKQN